MNEDLLKRIQQHEGYRQFAYNDSRGFSTIGIGRCINASVGAGVTLSEALFLLRNDITKLQSQLATYDWFKGQNECRKGVLIEAAFNLGLNGLLGFKQALNALSANHYEEASRCFQDSKWNDQIAPARMQDMMSRLVKGTY